jgi:hypothetical protein
MPIYKVTATRTQHVCTTVYAADEDYLDDVVADLPQEEWEVIRTLEVENFAYCIDHDAVEEN